MSLSVSNSERAETSSSAVLDERECVVEGVRVRYRVAGEGPPVVLVHGLAGSSRWWEPVVDDLAAELRVHLVDLPGFGSARRRRFVLADAPSYLRTAIAAFGLERTHLLGHSLGGAVCARVAALWPEVVGRLVLAAPAGLLGRRRPLGYTLSLAATFRRARPALMRRIAVDSLIAGPRTVYRAGTELLGDVNLEAELQGIRSPTLLLWGDRDLLVGREVAEQFAGVIPHASLVMLEGAGHVSMVDRPREFAREVLQFMAAPKR